MSWGRNRHPAHQSVYDKALTIFQEGTKHLEDLTNAIDRERIQSCIDHKLEERKIKQDFVTLIKERNRLGRESRSGASTRPLVSRQKSFREIQAHEKRRKLRMFSLARSCDTFPQITCTVANVPKIMKRNLSSESEFHNWITGRPKLANSGFVAPVEQPVAKRSTTKTKHMADTELEKMKHQSRKVADIVNNIPFFRKQDTNNMIPSQSKTYLSDAAVVSKGRDEARTRGKFPSLFNTNRGLKQELSVPAFKTSNAVRDPFPYTRRRSNTFI
ncbi:uncharacterized protein LOC116611761 [Nematostella vectensis]|uniref:uncharacterized protein LOC116611761 n=1 Tax=Nematostella vectensis TaxID=45351 RepID=UPI002076D586|nr:uncharacterized protein LOC116611761 [Nematostella vectensis]